MSAETTRASERIAAMRDRELTAALQNSVSGMDILTARAVLATVVPVLREQIAQDMAGLCARHGLDCAGDGCHHAFAALTARGIA